MIFAYLTLLIISPQDWVGPLYGLPVDYFLYPLWLGVLLATGRAKHLLRFGWQDLFMAAFVLWVSVSALANISSGISTQHLFMYVKWMVLYKFVAASLPSVGHMRRAAMVIVLLALVLSVESIQHMHSPDQIGWAGQSLGWISQSAMDEGVMGRTRWVSIFDGPGVFCVVFTLALPFLLQFLDKGHPAYQRIGALLLVAPLTLAIYYTGSRGGLLTALAILGMHFGARTKISVTKLAAVAVLLLGVFAVAPAYMTSIKDENRSAQHRVDAWMNGLEMVRYNPVLGIGKGNYRKVTGTIVAHNSAVEITAETGIPGAFLWVGLLYLGLKQIWLYLKQTRDALDRAFGMALGISLVGYLISSMFVTLEYETLYFMLGMTAAIGQQLHTPVQFKGRDAVLVLGSIGSFLLLLRAFTGVYY